MNNGFAPSSSDVSVFEGKFVRDGFTNKRNPLKNGQEECSNANYDGLD